MRGLVGACFRESRAGREPEPPRQILDSAAGLKFGPCWCKSFGRIQVGRSASQEGADAIAEADGPCSTLKFSRGTWVSGASAPLMSCLTAGFHC